MRPDDLLVDAEHHVGTQQLVQGRHDLALLEVLVGEVRAGERRQVEVQAVDLAAGRVAGHVDQGRGLLGEGGRAALEREVVEGDLLGEGREVRLDQRLDGAVLVLGVQLEQLVDLGDVTARSALAARSLGIGPAGGAA